MAATPWGGGRPLGFWDRYCESNMGNQNGLPGKWNQGLNFVVLGFAFNPSKVATFSRGLGNSPVLPVRFYQSLKLVDGVPLTHHFGRDFEGSGEIMGSVCLASKNAQPQTEFRTLQDATSPLYLPCYRRQGNRAQGRNC